jgi:hypothetical protein
MSLHNTFTHAVVCFGSENGVLLPIEVASEVFKLLGAGVQVEYSWGSSTYRYKKPDGSRYSVRLEAVCVTQLATMELEKD